MAATGIVTLASLRVQAQERSDQLNSSFLSTSEWNRNIQGSHTELFDLVTSAYGNDYYAAIPITFPTTGSALFYALPDGTNSFQSGIDGSTITPQAFYKMLGVDLILAPSAIPSAQQGSTVTIRPFNFADRNRYAVPNFQSFYGVTNLRYRIYNNSLWLTPIASSGQRIQLWYAPRPSTLQPEVICGTTSTSTTVTCSDTSALSTGMYVQAPANLSLFPANTTIQSINANVSFVVNNAATATTSNTLIRAWNDSVSVDGISGWEEYIVLDAALKAMGKEEDDVSLIAAQKQAMHQRLVDMAANRDAGNPATVADTQYSDFWWPTGSGSGSGWGAF